MFKFPDGFLWGAATSAHQVEGNNINSDWWEWEKRVCLRQTSGLACRSYELYKEDFDLACQLNHNAHRFSLEWSRIEPVEGEFSAQELGHYRDVLNSLSERNITPVVTLHHFTTPLWLAKSGGWQNKKAIKYFLRYTQKVVEELGSKVNYWVTINEPTVYIYYSYVDGSWPPQEKSVIKAKIVADNMAGAHIKAHNLIHSIYKKKNLPAPFVSIAHNMQAFEPADNSFKNKFAANLKDRLFNHAFIKKLTRHKSLDFIGLNYYSRGLVNVRGLSPRNLFRNSPTAGNAPVLKKNSLGWDIYPQGLHKLLLGLKRYNLPVFILENGICTNDDALRWEFIYAHLLSLVRAMKEGAKVIGYIYWSLIDNYEWDKGFGPRFGLIEVDYATYKRFVRESARKFSLICAKGELQDD